MEPPQRPRILWMAGIILSILFSTTPGQVTEIIRATDIVADPRNPRDVMGRLYPGAKVKKTGKDESGRFIKVTVEFYLPPKSLKEGRIARGIGDTQVANNASIKLVSARREGSTVKMAVEITNHYEQEMDMSALLLLRLVDGKGNVGNLEFMRSTNSVAHIKPGETLHSDLVYQFPETPGDVEMRFQAKLRGDQVYFILAF
ncbi:MAG: hypothetical protein ACE5GH_00995 [Fidelibacterota bacterium]